MIPTEAMHLLEINLKNASECDVEAFAAQSLEQAIGMIGYAVACGHISPAEHGAYWTLIRSIRESRRALKCSA